MHVTHALHMLRVNAARTCACLSLRAPAGRIWSLRVSTSMRDGPELKNCTNPCTVVKVVQAYMLGWKKSAGKWQHTAVHEYNDIRSTAHYLLRR